ncbi:glucose 1-dehydrogenase [Sphingobium sp.]|uniref:glucose 1-dehydrogenase n=1 Tax=Sphingobium sp. TaxID=1912891 RepID=UPI0028BE6F51|nr:glucose 1-dehydrogenase [Sphingobium sp.]
MTGSMQGKVALVTGGASGIGRAAAIIFAREGASVTIADTSIEPGEAVAQEIRSAGGNAIFVKTDVTCEDDIRKMVAKTVETFGGLDAAFNNAGTSGSFSTAATCTNEEWDRVMDINARSVSLCMKHEIPELLKRGGGGILNTASRAGDSGSPNMYTYITSKHAVVGMTRAAAIDFATRGIRVNALCPGFTYTGMIADAAKGAGLPPLEDVAKLMVPMQRIAEAEEQGEVAVFLCSDRASYITGHAMPVDGGMSATH